LYREPVLIDELGMMISDLRFTISSIHNYQTKSKSSGIRDFSYKNYKRFSDVAVAASKECNGLDAVDKILRIIFKKNTCEP
jgi:hypothetical protein